MIPTPYNLRHQVTTTKRYHAIVSLILPYVLIALFFILPSTIMALV